MTVGADAFAPTALQNKGDPVVACHSNVFSSWQKKFPTTVLFALVFLVWESAGGMLPSALAQKELARLPVSLHGVFFSTPEEGWVVGQLGKIFHTADAGKSWEEQPSGTNVLLAAVDFVDSSHGWVVGERGAILHSEDGGSSWKQQDSGSIYPLFDVEFIDRNTGWAVGHWGLILATQDGGKRWVERSLSLDLEERGLIDPAALRDVRDPETAEIVAEAGQILDGALVTEIQQRGITDVRIREDVVLNTVFFLDELHGWIGGESGLVLRTQDGGKTWERMVLPYLPLQEDEEASDIEMSQAELAAYGVVTPPPSVYDLHFVSPLRGWAVGQDGAIAYTQDGGHQWEFQLSGTRESLYDIGTIEDGGWIAGDKGTVLVSTDGGTQWERRFLGLEYRFFWLRRLAVVPGNHAFIVGADGLVLISDK